MEYRLDGGRGFTPRERNILIRRMLYSATRGGCSTRGLYRPFKERDLRAAFDEQNRRHRGRIAEYEVKLKEYDPEKLTEAELSLFGGVPSRERYAHYLRGLIKEEREGMRNLKHSYIVYVDYGGIGKKLLDFHNSLNPRVTFGYSSVLHEECDFLFDDEKREAFLHSSLGEFPEFTGFDWGVVTFGGMALVYEDLVLYRGDECILETVTHEEMMTVRLGEADLSEIEKGRGGKKLADKLREY